jgi:Domain of unknown function (DUF4388)
MSVALHGNLRDFGIAEVFQLIGQQRKTGTLEVIGEDSSTFLAFDQGRVVRGGSADSRSDREPLGSQLVRAGYLTREQLVNLERESERSARPISDLLLAAGLIEADTLADVQHLLTQETVFSVMRRKSGDFHFTAEAIQHDTQPDRLLGAEQILMDGLRMLDEWQTFAAVVPDEDLVFRRVGNLESARALTKGDSDARLGHAERILHLVDGRLSVRRIIDLSRLGTFEATRVLAELRQAGVIDVAEAAARPPTRRATAKNRISITQLLRVALATALPFVALGMLGVTALDRAAERVALPGTLIPEPLIGQLGARHETRLLRNLVEAHFFETGRYPARLEEIAPDLERTSHSLTRSQLAEYYYAVHEDEVVLLSPMR